LSDFYESFANNISKEDLECLKKLLLKNQRLALLRGEDIFAALQKEEYEGLESFLNCLLHGDHSGRSYEDFVLKLQKITKEGCG